MKRKNDQNLNGISISDSIVMSVKRKNANYRKPFSAVIAIIGFVSILMSFLGMFKFRYDSAKLFFAAVIFTAFYLTLSIIGRKALTVYGVSIIMFIVYTYRRSAKIALGFKFIYNIIYKDAYKTEINYYRAMEKGLEIPSTTTLLIFYIWLLAIVIYFFTVCRPNPVLPLIVTFPVLELGMYHGIEVPVFWGILCIAFWLALLAMSTIDVGEYSGGQSGFVRKNNLFFPKRHMKLKVTEKCGALIVASVMLIACLSYGAMKITNYKRSEKINQKRRDISEALNDFSFDNFAESFANLSAAVGFDFEYENHKLGNNDHVRYKNVTDITVTLNHLYSGAIYLKDYSGSVYKNNEWFDLPESAYSDSLFKDFDKYKVYPQDFLGLFSKQLLYPAYNPLNIKIKNSAKKSSHVYSPYGTVNSDNLTHNKDLTVSAKKDSNNTFKYDFITADTETLVSYVDTIVSSSASNNLREVYSFADIKNNKWRDSIEEYCSDNDLTSFEEYFPVDFDIPTSKDYLVNNGSTLMAELLEDRYKQFVYDNYLQVPKNKDMEEVRNYYDHVLSGAHDTAAEKLEVLGRIKSLMNDECDYSLSPHKTPSNRDFVNYFLLENHKGYCTHFASAGVMLARMAGIPARYATGYILVETDISGGKRGSDGSVTINVKDNRSHAWVEVYLDEIGWVPYEFTKGYSAHEINTEPTTEATSKVTSTVTSFVTTTSSKKASHTTNGLLSSTTSITTSAETTVDPSNSGNGGGSGSVHRKTLPKAVKKALLYLLIIALLIGLVLLRRYIILRIRSKKLHTGQASARVKNMYSYAEKLLEAIDLQSENGNYRSFAYDVEKRLGGEYFDAGSFIKLTDIALMASFSQGVPDSEDIKLCEKTINDISSNLYNRSSFIQKIKLMFINVLR